MNAFGVARPVLRYLERQEFEPVDEESEEDVVDRQIMDAERSLAALINEWTEGRMSEAGTVLPTCHTAAVLSARGGGTRRG